MPASLRRADEQIVRPLDVGAQPGHALDRFRQRHARRERHERGRPVRRDARAAWAPGRPRHTARSRRRKPVRPRRPRPAVCASAIDDGALVLAARRQVARDVVGRPDRSEKNERASETAEARAQPAAATRRSSRVSEVSAVEAVQRRLDLKADVHGGRRVRQRADRDVVGAGRRQLRDAFERHAAGDFDLGAAARARDGFANVVERQVVGQDDVGARGERLVHLTRASAPRLRSAAGLRCAHVRATAAWTPPASRTWLSLIRIASKSPAR